jgi:hypothetical protein
LEGNSSSDLDDGEIAMMILLISCWFIAASFSVAATAAKMPQAHFDASVESPHLDVILDVGHPLANRVVDGFIKVGGVGFVHGATQEAYRLVLKG